jgi:hypothetical protein
VKSKTAISQLRNVWSRVRLNDVPTPDETKGTLEVGGVGRRKKSDRIAQRSRTDGKQLSRDALFGGRRLGDGNSWDGRYLDTRQLPLRLQHRPERREADAFRLGKRRGRCMEIIRLSCSDEAVAWSPSVRCARWYHSLSGINSAIGLYVQDRSNVTGTREAKHTNYQEAQSELQRVTEKLASIGSHRSVREIDSLISATLARPLLIGERIRGTIGSFSEQCTKVDARTALACAEVSQLRSRHTRHGAPRRVLSLGGQQDGKHVADWMAQRAKPSNTRGAITLEALLADYCKWCTETDVEPLTLIAFALEFDRLREMPELANKIRKFGNRYYGIALMDEVGG